MKTILPLLVMLCYAGSVFAQEKPVSPEDIRKLDPIAADAYFKQSLEINKVRRTRLIDIDTLLAMLADKNTVLLDVRGDDAYAQQHIRGAVHLSLSDMTPATLAKAIASKDARVILYCDAALTPYPTRRIALSTEAYPLVYQHGYTHLYEVKELWDSKASSLRREYEDYLKLPLEGDAKAVAYGRKYAQDCLASGKPPCAQ
jgi:hypothetical protein